MNTIDIAGKKIGEGFSTFVIAEAGVNHGGDIELAKRHIREAKLAGADAIKFQTYKAQNLVTKDAPIYWRVGSDKGKSQYQVFSQIHNFPIEFYKQCLRYAQEIGIIFLSTPFGLEAVDLLEKVGIPAYKIASGDLTYHQLLEKVAKTNKPIILSTGASTVGEIEESVNVIKAAGNNQIILLHCTLAYPTDQKDANLKMIPTLSQLFPEFPIGYSDHTFDPMTPAFCVMLGAKVVEKHFTVDKTLEGSSDHKLGVDPYQLKVLVEEVRQAEKSLGREDKTPVETERDALMLARRSLVSARKIKKGNKITKEMLICKRPGTGIAPKFMSILVGKTAKKDIPEDTVISWEMV